MLENTCFKLGTNGKLKPVWDEKLRTFLTFLEGRGKTVMVDHEQQRRLLQQNETLDELKWVYIEGIYDMQGHGIRQASIHVWNKHNS